MVMKLKSNTAVKVTAVILLFLTCAGTFLSAFLCFIMAFYNSYLAGGIELKSTAVQMLISSKYYAMDAYLDAVYSGNEEAKNYYFGETLSPDKTNLRFYISDSENNYVASNADKDSFTELDSFNRTFTEEIDDTEIYVEKAFATSIDAYSFINDYKTERDLKLPIMELNIMTTMKAMAYIQQGFMDATLKRLRCILVLESIQSFL